MFAPIAILVRRLIRQPQFNQLRTKTIALQSQAITHICNRLRIERTTR
ncbi:MAG: electron transporter [Prochloraceae cyanobacterium]